MTVRRALLWSFAERYANLILSLATSMIVARLLTPAEIGKFSLCAAALAVGATLRDFGISEYIIQEKELTTQRLRAAYGVAIAVAWTVGGAIFLLRGPIAAFYAEPELVALISVLTINFLILPFATPAFALLNRELAFKRVFVIQVISGAIQSVLAVLLAWRGHGALSLAWASVAGIAVQLVIVSFMRPKSSLLLPGWRGARHVLRYGVYAVTGRVIDTATGNAHEFIIAKQFGFTELGLISRAMGVVEMFGKNVTAALTRVAMPAMASAHRNAEDLVGTFARTTAAYTGVAWPFTVFIVIAAPEIIAVLFGPQWGAAAPLVSALALCLLPGALYAFSASTLAAMGQVQRRLRISALFSPVHIASLLLTALVGGFTWMPWAWVLTHGVLLALHTHHLKAAMGTQARALYRPSLVSLWPTAATGLALGAALAATRAAGWPALTGLLLASGAAVPAWCVAVWVSKHPLQPELQRAQAYAAARLRAAR